MTGKKRLSRRRFLGEAALGVATVACGSDDGADGTAAGGTSSAGAGGAGGAAAGARGGSGGAPSPTGRPVVSAVDVSDAGGLDAAVARAVALAGGLDAIEPGQTVFIKPNAVSDRAVGSGGIRTDPDVLAAVVRLVRERDPGRIVVGDRSARSFPDTQQVFDATGLGEAALAAGADEIYAAENPAIAPDEWVLQQPPGYENSWGAAGGIWSMRRLLEADHVINVPVCKNHRFALFSLSMKNFIGAIGDVSRDPLHYGDSLALDFQPLGREIAIINGIFSPTMNVLDATTALVNGGPQGDGADAVRTTPGLIFASSDRVALDALGVALLKRELEGVAIPSPDASHQSLTTTSPWQLPQIATAIELGLGAEGAAAVDLALEIGAAADALEAIFRS